MGRAATTPCHSPVNLPVNPISSLKALTLAVIVLGLAVLSGCNTARIGAPEGWSAGAVDDDILYIGTMEGEVLAVNKLTGDTEWRRELPSDEDSDRAIYGRPAIADSVVLVGGYDGRLYAYDTTGDLEWQEPLTGRIVGGPTVHQGLVLVGTGEVSSSNGSGGTLYAIDIEAADPIWSYRTGGPIWSTPAVADGVAYVGSLDHQIHAVDITDGSPIWVYTTGGAIVSGIAVHEGLVIFGGFDSTLYALDAESGELVWDFRDSTRWYWSTPLIHQGAVYAPSLDGTLYALDAATGSLKWRYETEGQLVGSPAIVNNLIAVPIADGGDSKIALLELNGSEQAACKIGADVRTSIEVSDDLIYFAATDHTIRALRVKASGNPDEEWVFVTNADPHPPDRARAC